MTLEFLFPPSIGASKAGARAELAGSAVSKRLGHPIRVAVAEDYHELMQRVMIPSVDLAWAPPSICAMAQSHSRAVFKIVRDHSTSYCAALLCRREDAVSVRAVRGLRAAWVDSLSTAGYALPRAFLRQMGLDPARVLEEEATHGSYSDAAMAVVCGQADICAIFATERTEEAVRRTLDKLIAANSQRLVPFAFTSHAPNDALILTRRAPDALATQIIEILSSRGKPPHQLLDLCEADGFALAQPGDYDHLRMGITPIGPAGG